MCLDARFDFAREPFVEILERHWLVPHADVWSDSVCPERCVAAGGDGGGAGGVARYQVAAGAACRPDPQLDALYAMGRCAE